MSKHAKLKSTTKDIIYKCQNVACGHEVIKTIPALAAPPKLGTHKFPEVCPRCNGTAWAAKH